MQWAERYGSRVWLSQAAARASALAIGTLLHWRPVLRCAAAQMVSLLHLADITEEGVAFQSPTDGQRMLLTPEHSMAIQVGLPATGRATRRSPVSAGARIGKRVD